MPFVSSLRHAARGLSVSGLALVAGLISCWALGAVSPVAAAAEADPWTPTFHLERILVEGLRHAEADLIVTDSLLEADRTYDEDELRAAVDRVRRLPYVRDASFALRKGSRRGLYELVITIEETRRFFFGANMLYSRFIGNFFFEPENPLEQDSDLAALAGARFFVGRHGTAFVALREARVQVGYSRNQLFGRSASLRVGYEESIAGSCCDSRVFGSGLDPSFASWNRQDSRGLSLGLTLPFDAHDGVAAEIEIEESGEGRRSSRFGGPSFFGPFHLFEDFRRDRLVVSWFRDTTDDSVFARRGSRLVASLSHERLEAELSSWDVPFQAPSADPELSTTFSSEAQRLELLGSRWWSPTPRQTFWGTLSLAVSTTDLDGFPLGSDLLELADLGYESHEIAAELGHRVRLFDGAGLNRELFWETRLLFARDEASTDVVPGVLEHQTLQTSLVWRTSWGLFRFGIRYVDVADSFDPRTPPPLPSISLGGEALSP